MGPPFNGEAAISPENGNLGRERSERQEGGPLHAHTARITTIRNWREWPFATDEMAVISSRYWGSAEMDGKAPKASSDAPDPERTSIVFWQWLVGPTANAKFWATCCAAPKERLNINCRAYLPRWGAVLSSSSSCLV